MDRPTPTGPPAPDLRILESRVYRGGNIWSYEPAVHLLLDLGVLEGYPTDTLPGFTDRLLGRFTTALAPHLPDVVREPGWTLAVDRACAAWILAMTGWLIDGADEDRPRVGPPGVPSPSYRQLLTTRWRWGAVRLHTSLPGVAGLLGAAAAWADEEWGESAAPVGPYRAFARDE